MTQNYLHYNTDLCSGKYTCISPFRRTHLSGEYLDVAVGDILVVKSRPRNATAPKSFLYGVNQTTGSEGYFPACCIDVHALGPNINPQLHVRSKSIDRLVSALSSISRPISSTNIDANISQPIVPPRNKRLLNVSSASISTVRFISQSSRSCTNLSISNQGLSLHTSEQCHGSVPTLFARCHQFQDVSVSYPRLCALCGDYVVTPRCKANRCLACKSLFHLICAEFSKRFGKSPCQSEENVKLPTTQQKTTYPNASSDIYPLSSSSVSINEQPLISWNPTQVAHWLAVVGLGRFVALFLKLNLDGSFLSKVTPDSPYLSQVIDPFAREALKQAILVLQGQNPAPGEDVSIFTKLERKKISLDKPEIIGKHDFQLTSFYRVVSCIVCNVPLLGFAHQGFQCKACGAICHRICKALDGFSDCLGNFTVLQSSVHEELSTSCESTEIPTSLVPYISDYFGVKLEDQKLDSTSKLPIFLAACTEQIEKLANESFITASNNPHTQPIDMVMVYQQSALAHTLQELHNTFAHCLPLPDSEQSSVLPLDIVRLAQLMKAFLRDLPVAVIPEEYYLDFCHLANITNTDEKILAVRKFLDNLPEIHRLCLIHIFNHLGFVVNHQNKLRSYLSNLSPINITQSNSLNAPSKLTLWLMVFRQILVRPPWHLITDIAMGMDTHMRALEAVFGVVVGSCVTDESENTSHIESSLSIPFVSEPNPDMNTSIARRKCDPQSSSDKHKSSELVAPCRTDAIVVPTIVTPPSPSSTAVNKKDLENQEWYWGDITQEEVREIMTGLQDGYYLVRDASQRSVAAFTLVVRWHGENKLNRIYHRGDYFGFTDPPQPTFRLVSELINFCRAHPLTVSSYSSLRLIWPVSRRHKRFNDKIDASSDSNVSAENRCSSGVFACFLSDSQLSSELKNIVVKITQLDKLITDLELQSKNAVDLKEEAFRLMKAYTNLHKWLQTSLSRLNDYSCPSEKSKISPQIETLNDEMNKAEQQIKTNKEEVSEQCKTLRIIFEKCANAVSQQRKLKRQAQEIRRALKDRGFNEESLSSSTSSLIDGSIPSVSSSVDTQSTEIGFTKQAIQNKFTNPLVDTSVPEEIRDRRYWFLTGVTREKVEALLADRPPGTFVIRPSTAGNKLALGVRLESSVQHCLIHCIEGKYGFVEKSCTYDSLEALVCYHHVHSLKRYNNLLNITLRYPFKLHLNT